MRPMRASNAYLGLLASGLLTAFTAGAQSPASESPAAAPEPAAGQVEIAPHLADIRRLLTQLDALETQLIEQARRMLDHADAARNHDERRGWEQLYGEIGARIEQLRVTRRDLNEQLERLGLEQF